MEGSILLTLVASSLVAVVLGQTPAVPTTAPMSCPADEVPCTGEGFCIPDFWVCDGFDDCFSGLDEVDCPSPSPTEGCASDQFECGGGGCIFIEWVCDFEEDCLDGSDEEGCEGCASDQFECGDGGCISIEWVCDFEEDCLDGSDEEGCEDVTCTEEQFTCNSGQCIRLDWYCDEFVDCFDGSDEFCGSENCEDGQVECFDTSCINGTQYCDHISDCPTGGDEGSQCDYPACDEETHFTCGNGRCLSMELKCNGENDCEDNTDESESLCAVFCPEQFKCGGGDVPCVERYQVCDNSTDCSDGSDEAMCDQGSCRVCEHTCAPIPHTPNGFQCVCNRGYLLVNATHCEDIDECAATPWVCSQQCQNSVGGYQCSCVKDYTLTEDNSTCKSTKDLGDATIFFANRYYIRSLSLDNTEYSLIEDEFKVLVGLDFDYRTEKLYTLDHIAEKLERINLDGTGRETILEDVSQGDSLTIDWVARNIYFVESGRDMIGVTDLEGIYQKVLVSEGLFEPRGIAVHPFRGLLYYTDWGFDAYIGRIGTDGQAVAENPQIHDSNIVWPNAITIDFTSDKLFWTDAHLNYIAYADLDGSNMFILSGLPPESVSHPFSVAVFEDEIFWTEWNYKKVHKAKKFTGSDYEELRELGVRPYTIRVYHPLEQDQTVPNPCGTNECSHLCLTSLGGGGYTCACPEHFDLMADQKTCDPVCDNVNQHFKCSDNSKCIPAYWKCDGQVDCDDGSDEPRDCVIECDPRQLHCGDNTCVGATSICNNRTDCPDGRDEEGCATTICHEWQFRCESGACIHERDLCDGNPDCPHGDDESDTVCATEECPRGYFKCANGQCVPEHWVCDLDNDCGDFSDEPGSCYGRTCEPGWFSCVNNYRCIPSWAVCDGLNHCRDGGSDEANCGDQACEVGYFRCDNDRCIPDRWVCNFRSECGDDSDEGTMCADQYRNCTEFEFQCASSKCITRYQVCDQEADCEDGDDEIDCVSHVCPTGLFQCGSGQCINEELMCDGEPHCPDLSDELASCPTRYPGGRHCFSSEFTCNNTVCIPSGGVCDRVDDCMDGSDETYEVCLALPCDEDTHFRCENAHCIPQAALCDGEDQCGDGSDEDAFSTCDSSKPLKCDDDEFTCGDGDCIPFEDVCDGLAHCSNGTDELCQTGTCAVEGANCTQSCRDIGAYYACFCDEGYRPSQEIHTCLDVDECAEFNPCIQRCQNSVPGYTCTCIDGFEQPDSSGLGVDLCFPTGEGPLLLESLGNELKVYNLSSDNYSMMWDLPFSWIESLDYDFSDGTVFLLDSERNALIRTDFDNSDPVDIHPKGVHRPRTVAVDWVGKNVYWTDLGMADVTGDDHLNELPRISVIDFAGQHQQTVVRLESGLPKGLAVSCRRGLMYWFNTMGSTELPVIESAWMNGRERQELVTRGLVSVEGIAVDYNHNDVVYFVDSFSGVFSMNYDGSFLTRLGASFGIEGAMRLDVFGSFIYWTAPDRSDAALFQFVEMDKLGRVNPVNRRVELEALQDLKIVHPLKYNPAAVASNPCQGHPCSHLCLLTPPVMSGPARLPFMCACPDGLHLLPGDPFTCQQGPGPACVGAENGGCSHLCLTGSQGEPICECPPDLRLDNNRRVCVAMNASCPPTFFTCTNGICIPESWKCDVDDDCTDNSDELYSTCYDHQCESNEFECNNRRCVPEEYRCDFDNDCRDGSDELQQDCPFPECPEDAFQCGNFECVNSLDRCDGFQDCGDLSDEVNCTDPAPCIPWFPGIEFERCPGNNLCVPSIFICDSENDCVDNSDEDLEYCSNVTCGPLEYQCGTGNCIPGTWHCDGFQDCFDFSDEPEDCETTTCLPNFFRCGSGGPCIPNHWLCDLDNDCGDNSDEDEAICPGGTPPPCLGDVFQCEVGKPGYGRCIPHALVCDGISDCEEGDDEMQDCPDPEPCLPDEFMCDNRLCIPESYECDHDNDCGDSSDEGSHCHYETCSPGQFTCNNGRCIFQGFFCDGEDDCRDNSDESHELCGLRMSCMPDEFTCSSGRCINDTLVCDGIGDCFDDSDETNCERDECSQPLGMLCESGCVDTPTSYKCTCEEGFVLSEDGVTCQDIDECRETPWVCNNICENLPGSYLCKCGPGYQRSEVSGECRRDSAEVPYLYFTNRHYIRKLALDGSEFDLVEDGFDLAVAFDVDLVEEKLYVLDVVRESIIRMNLDGSDQETIIDEFVANGEGLALDWIGRKIYWVDRLQDVMEVAELDGSLRKTLLHEGLSQPRAVVVDPREGYVFWTDFGLIPYIGRRGMDGQGEFVKLHNEKLLFPFGLSIDYDTSRLFWVDAHLDYIGYSDFDGGNFHIIPSQGDETYFRPFAVTVFEEFIYWTDWSEMTVFRAHKFTGLNRTQLVQVERHRPYDVHVFHPYLQRLDIPNPCGDNNGDCSHLCLLSEGGGYSCACPDGFDLNDDNQTCTPSCGSYTFACLDHTKCIPSYYECDGTVDCQDSSDEHGGCGHPVCPRGTFYCDDRTCLHPLRICDGESDCLDDADEELCNHEGTMTECHPWEYRCNSGLCIPSVFKCDTFQDCPGDDDESDALCETDEACNLGYFHCDNGLCIPESWVCDLDNDCGDNSDEPHRTCQREGCLQDNWFRCETNYRCIPPYGVCDGNDNCRDNSDEKNCADMTCGPGQFKCDDHTCLPDWLVCDHRPHCADGSDESYETCGNYTHKLCSESEFRCDNGQCIQGAWVCDGFPDCVGFEDEPEEVCPDVQCANGYRKCAETGICIPESFLCDGERDCLRGDDESDCPTRFPNGHYCYRYQFECANQVCIEVGSTCNGVDDCGDNSDEAEDLCGDCDHANLFGCDSGECIADWEQCDGIPDCADRSDEDHRCAKVCAEDEFVCSSSGTCIRNEFVCDRYQDCPHREDEDQYCDYTRIKCTTAAGNDTCDQMCRATLQFSYCGCGAGYRPNQTPFPNNQRICENIDECAEYSHTCDHICYDLRGSFGCRCQEGYYEVGNNTGRCNVTGARPKLVFGDGTQLRFFNYHTNREGTIVSGEGRIDKVDIHNGVAYWTDTALKVIKRATIPASEDGITVSQVIVGRGAINHPTGLSLDFSGGNVYWLDQGDAVTAVGKRRKRQTVIAPSTVLKVASLEGGSPKTLITGLDTDVGDIVVNPRRGVMYWYNLGGNPSIEWAWMSGDNREVLVSDRLREPSGLTIDFAQDDNVYFSDRSLSSIEVMTWNGRDRRLIARSPDLLQPVGLEVFESFLYWSTSSPTTPYTLMKMDKRGESGPMREVGNLLAPTSVKMDHPLRNDLQESPNPCQGAACSSLCTVVPSNRIGEEITFSCQCGDGDSFVDINDKTVCNKTVGSTRPPLTPAPTPEIDVCGCIKNQGSCDLTTKACRCYHKFTGEFCETALGDCSGNGVPQRNGICKCITGFEGTVCDKPVPAGRGESSPEPTDKPVPAGREGLDQSPSALLIVVIVVMIVLILVIIMVAALYLRRSKRKSESPPTVVYSGDDVKIPTNPEPMPLQFTNPNFASLNMADGKDSGLPNDYEEVPKKGSDIVELDLSVGDDPPDPGYASAMKTFTPAAEGGSDTYNLVVKDPE